MNERVPIRRLPSGVPGLDEVLGGGIPEFSFNLLAGGPGCGKTTLAQQIMFANAGPDRRALFVSVLGEPPLKMLRYQQQYSFFDPARVGRSVNFLYLGQEATQGLQAVLDRIVREVERESPGMVFVDSFRAVVRRAQRSDDGGNDLESFVERLALHLTSAEATTFLLGEHHEHEGDNPVFTLADGILWLYQAVERNSIVRKLQVVKMRGQGQIPGLHTARITERGFSVFPRLPKPEEPQDLGGTPPRRLSTGVPGLDEMLGGGIPAGYTLLLAGPSGSGKTVLSNQFLLEGLRQGERAIVAIFEKRPHHYLRSTPHGRELAERAREGALELIYLRPLDLSIDETLLALQEAVQRTGARRAVIDSLSGLELALAPTFREDFRESLYRMLGALTAMGVTVVATVEQADAYNQLRFSPQDVSFLSDAVVIQRYAEIGGKLRRLMAVVKVRASAHSQDLRAYEITEGGMQVMAEPLRGYEGLLTGSPRLREPEAGAEEHSHDGQDAGSE